MAAPEEMDVRTKSARSATGDADRVFGMLVTLGQPLSCFRVSLGSGGSDCVLFPIRIKLAAFKTL